MLNMVAVPCCQTENRVGGKELLFPTCQAWFQPKTLLSPPAAPVSTSTVTRAKNSSDFLPCSPSVHRGGAVATCQSERRLKSQAPDTDGQSPLPHVFAIRVTARFGVAVPQLKTS